VLGGLGPINTPGKLSILLRAIASTKPSVQVNTELLDQLGRPNAERYHVTDLCSCTLGESANLLRTTLSHSLYPISPHDARMTLESRSLIA